MSRIFGLIGFPLSHSFSKRYFTEKFQREHIPGCSYELFPLEMIEMLPDLISMHPGLAGLNVTIPYKESVIPFLDAMDTVAGAVGAVNAIAIDKGRLTGYNTDVYGFEVSLTRFIHDSGKKPPGALVLGTGGASKAVCWVLRKMEIPFLPVSRTAGANLITYDRVEREHLARYPLVINTTPAGMAPYIDQCPPIPYEFLTAENLLFDLVYNPEKTRFLERGEQSGCRIQNGLEMLYLQAEHAWALWNPGCP